VKPASGHFRYFAIEQIADVEGAGQLHADIDPTRRAIKPTGIDGVDSVTVWLNLHNLKQHVVFGDAE
jgi:hypothetical protein